MKTNKLNTFIAIMLVFFVFSSCDKIEKLTQKDVVITPDYVLFTIPQITSIEEGSINSSFDVEINLDDIIKAKAPGFGIGNIKSIKLKSLQIELLDQDATNNFNAVEKLSAQIQATNLSQKILASVTNSDFVTPKYSLIIPVTGGDIELKDYLKATNFKYTISGKAHHTTTKELRAKLTASYTFTLRL